MSSRGVIRSGSGRKLLAPRGRLVSKENKNKKNDCWFALARGVDYHDFYWLKKLLSIKIAHVCYRDKGPLNCRGVASIYARTPVRTADNFEKCISLLPESVYIMANFRG